MHIASKGRLFLLLGCTLLLTACTADLQVDFQGDLQVRQSEMTVTEQIFPAKPHNKLLYRAVFIPEINSYSSKYHNALAESLLRQGWLADFAVSAFLLLEASFIKADEPQVSQTGNMKTTTYVRYVLTENATGRVVMQEDIQGVGIAGVGDGLYGKKRAMITIERSYRDNIFKFMHRLDAITRQAYDKDLLVAKFEVFNIFGETTFFDAYPPERIGYSRPDFLKENFSKIKNRLVQTHPDNLRKFRSAYATYMGSDDLQYIDSLIQAHVINTAKPADDAPDQGAKKQATKRPEKSASPPPEKPTPVVDNPNPF